MKNHVIGSYEVMIKKYTPVRCCIGINEQIKFKLFPNRIRLQISTLKRYTPVKVDVVPFLFENDIIWYLTHH